MVVLGQSGYIWAKVFVFGQIGCIRTKVVVSGQSGYIRAGLLYLGTVVVFGQKWFFSCKNSCNREKKVVFGQKWLYSGNVVVFE